MKAKWKWNLFWLAALIIFSFLIIFGSDRLKIEQLAYLPLVSFFFILTAIFFILAIKNTEGGHNFFRHPISFVGQTSVFGKLNRKAFSLFILYSFSICTIPFFLSNIIGRNFDHISFTWFRYVLYLATLSIIMMGLIPIDIDRPKHLIATVGVFACGVTINVMMLIFTHQLGSQYFGYTILAIAELASSVIYMIGYFTHFRASMFQKFWLILVMISIYMYNILFLGLI